MISLLPTDALAIGAGDVPAELVERYLTVHDHPLDVPLRDSPLGEQTAAAVVADLLTHALHSMAAFAVPASPPVLATHRKVLSDVAGRGVARWLAAIDGGRRPAGDLGSAIAQLVVTGLIDDGLVVVPHDITERLAARGYSRPHPEGNPMRTTPEPGHDQPPCPPIDGAHTSPADLGHLLEAATLAADSWVIANRQVPMTARDVTRGVVKAGVSHLIEQGLLTVPPNLAAPLETQIPADRQETLASRLITDRIGRHVLHYYGDRRNGLAPGNYVKMLILLIDAADQPNLERLAAAPGYVQAVNLANHTPDGKEQLLMLVESLPR